jgi:hypothetical protein
VRGEAPQDSVHGKRVKPNTWRQAYTHHEGNLRFSMFVQAHITAEEHQARSSIVIVCLIDHHLYNSKGSSQGRPFQLLLIPHVQDIIDA